jgi:hypothetical protein
VNKIDTLFDRMDEWRHFPNYQLERRADLFFSLYMSDVLEEKLGFPMAEKIIPEFPARIGTLYPDIPIDKSYKIDYVALSADTSKAILIELKTEGLSRSDKQDKYLHMCREVGFKFLLEGVLDIFRATKSKRKYFNLLLHLEGMDLLEIPTNIKEIMSRPNIRGAVEASREIEISSNVLECIIIYIQPISKRDDEISFEDFRSIVLKNDDAVSRRFSKSLSEWARVQAGLGNATEKA